MPASKDPASILLTTNIINRMSKKSDIVNHLNELHKVLSTMSQEISEQPKSLKTASMQLVSPKLLNNKDKDIRLLSICCIVDVLRIYAPDAPYGNEDMIRVFEGIMTQLHSLPTCDASSGMSNKVVYILSSIATVKSCVVPVILAQSGVPGASEIVSSMFEALFSSIRSDHTDEIFEYAAAVLQSCVEEFDDFDEEVLDALLLPLLPANKADSPAAYQLAATVLRHVAPIVEAPVSALLNQLLVGGARPGAGSAGAHDSELSEHLYPLIYELHKISPAMLSRVLPNVCLQLQVEEVEVRLRAVKLLSSLFCSTHAEYAAEYQRNFKEFLGRLADMDQEVRMETLIGAAAVFEAKPAVRALIEDPLSKRLRDPSEEVRLAVLQRLLRVAYSSPLALSAATFADIGERAKDRRSDVRRAALVGLARTYSRHVSSVLPPLKDLTAAAAAVAAAAAPAGGAGGGSGSASKSGKSGRISSGGKGTQGLSGAAAIAAASTVSSSVHAGLLDRLSFVPELVIKSWGFPEFSTKALVIQLLQEYILPRAVGSSAAPSHVTGSSSDEGSDDADSSRPSTADSSDAPTGGKVAVTSTHSGAELCEVRASALLLLFELLSAAEGDVEVEHGLKAFSAVLSFKGRVCTELQTFLDIRQAMKSKHSSSQSQQQQQQQQGRLSTDSVMSVGATADADALASAISSGDVDALVLLRKSAVRLMQLAPPPDKKAAHLEKLHAVKDKLVFKLLAHCTAAKDDVAQAMAHRDDVQRRLDSKSALGEYVGTLYNVAGHMLSNGRMTKSLLHHMSALMAAAPIGTSTAATEAVGCAKRVSRLLTLISKHAGKSFAGSVVEVTDWLRSCVDAQEAGVDGSKSRKGPSSDSGSGSGSGRAAEITHAASNVLFEQSLIIVGNASAVIAQQEADQQQYLCGELVMLLKSNRNPGLCAAVAELLVQLAYHVNVEEGEEPCGDSPDVRDDELCPIEAVQYLTRHLTSARCLSLKNKRLDCDLSALAALVSTPKSAYLKMNLMKRSFQLLCASAQASRKSIRAFVWTQLVQNPESSAMVDNGALKTLTLGYALQALTNVLSGQEELRHLQTHAGPLIGTAAGAAHNNSSSSSSSSSHTGCASEGSTGSAAPAAEFLELIDVLFDCIDTSGEHIGSIVIETPVEDEEVEVDAETAAFIAAQRRKQAQVCEAAVACALTLMKLTSFATSITTDQWHSLGWALICSAPDAQHRLLAILSQTIQMHPVHPKFMVYPCLFATLDDAALHSRAEHALCFAVQRLRRTHEDLLVRRAAVADGADDADNDEKVDGGEADRRAKAATVARLQGLADRYMPEGILPYLLHLLSYHPEFPTTIAMESDEDKRRMKAVVRAVRMLLNVLQSSLVNDRTSNMSFLFKQLNTINQQYIDRHDADNIGLHFVTRMTVKLLNEQMKTQDNLHLYTGAILLPQDLYRRKEQAQSKTQRNLELGAGISLKEGLEEAEQAIDKVLQMAGKGGRVPAMRAGGAGTGAAGAYYQSGATELGTAEPGSAAKGRKGGKRSSPPSAGSRFSGAGMMSDGFSPANVGGGSGKKRNRAQDSSSAERQQHTSGGNSKINRPMPEEEPTRRLPSRSAKAAVSSYRDPDESEKEVRRWEEQAARAAESAAARAKRPRSSGDSQSSFGSFHHGFSSTFAPAAGGGGGGGNGGAFEEGEAAPRRISRDKDRDSGSSWRSNRKLSDSAAPVQAQATLASEAEGEEEEGDMDLFGSSPLDVPTRGATVPAAAAAVVASAARSKEPRSVLQQKVSTNKGKQQDTAVNKKAGKRRVSSSDRQRDAAAWLQSAASGGGDSDSDDAESERGTGRGEDNKVATGGAAGGGARGGGAVKQSTGSKRGRALRNKANTLDGSGANGGGDDDDTEGVGKSAPKGKGANAKGLPRGTIAAAAAEQDGVDELDGNGPAPKKIKSTSRSNKNATAAATTISSAPTVTGGRRRPIRG